MTSIDWSAMTAEEIAAVVESAPVVLGEWRTHISVTERVPLVTRPGHRRCGVWETHEACGRWAWLVREVGGASATGRAPTREAAMAAADAAARERGWRLMGGE